ncbi:MAG TPA: MerR family transcriptional regulator [Thermoanaerobaculia bacterium]|nr:MerR family transcriptional regulator [Thermoanaerobaculia bacterium]
MRIGELAKRTGISVRTLHHYDEIGLLSPSGRTEAGHRIYEREEIVRLQQILSLRQMSFSLEQIRELLGRRDFDAHALVRDHIARLREQIAAQQELCARLEAIEAHYASATTDEFIQAIEVMTMFDKYYSKEQLDTLAKRREMFGEEKMREFQEEWPRLIAAVREEMERGTDPKDPRVQALAKRWMELIDAFTGGDEGILQSLKNFYRGEPEFAKQQGVDGGMGEYIQRSLQ